MTLPQKVQDAMISLEVFARNDGFPFEDEVKCAATICAELHRLTEIAESVDPLVIRLHDVTTRLEAANALLYALKEACGVLEALLKRTVYLVYGYDNYEYPCAPIKAFVSEVDARSWLAKIIAHHENRQPYPGDGFTDEEFDAWDKVDAQWRETHPAADSCHRDYFDVMPLELVPPSTPEKAE
jgi:hypothetical protein